MQFFSRLNIDGFNSRPLTEDDFFRICENEGITVLERDVSTSFYLCVLDSPVIVIRRRLRGLRRLFAQFHELGHHFCHGGRAAGPAAFFSGLGTSRAEHEADAFALVALVPAPALAGYDFLEENPSRFALRLFTERRRLRMYYGV